jgi:hypothetical protein
MSEEEVRKCCIAIAGRFMPDILLALLAKQKIDRDRIGDREYVWSVVLENLDMLEEWEAVHVIDEEFIASAKEAAGCGRISVALVLIATAIEHKLNLFYREILEWKCGLGRDDATQVIRNNADIKIGWLFNLVIGKDMSEELKKRIRQINQWRNSLVHYKAVPLHINDTSNVRDRILCEVRETGVEKVLNLPMDLEEELTKVRLEVIALLEESQKLAEAMLSEENQST